MKIALILPYFGHFDSMFPLWLESCRYNTDFEWIIFTDDNRTFDYPDNVKVVYISFGQLRERIQKLYDFKIALDAPYRLCNFRPAFGEIFEQELRNYDAWGFCDNDMLFGRLSANLPSVNLKYKIGAYGHLSFVPNTEETRTIYQYKNAFKIAFSHSELLFFDEDSFPKILQHNGYTIYKLHIADFKPRLKKHFVLNEPGREWMNKAHCFVWDKGTLWRFFVGVDGNVCKEEYTYIHFLKRPMIIDEKINSSEPIVIIPNRIFNMQISKITPSFLKNVSKGGIFWKYWRNSLRPKNLVERLKNRLYRNMRNRQLIDKMNAMISK